MRVPFETSSHIIGCVEDIDGHLYWCNEARETNHGFYIWFGWREEYRAGSAMAVFTQEIADHMAKHGFSYQESQLPICDKVWRRFRKKLGVSHPIDKDYRARKKANTPPPLFIKDFEGNRYKVTHHQSCDLGIIIYRGFQIDKEYSSPRYILTPALAAIIKEWSEYPIKLANFLPFDVATLSMLRQQLGMDWQEERLLWWSERVDDLLNLPSKQFVAKHGKKLKTVQDERSAVGTVYRRNKEPELHAEFFIQMNADWSDKMQDIKRTLGKDYPSIRRYRRAYKILKMAGKLDEAA